MSSDRTKNIGSTHAVSWTTSEMRAVSERPAETTVVVVEQKRKRYTAQQKLEPVRLTYLPGNTVSSVARSYGIALALLFRWRALDKQGELTAIETGQSSAPVKQYAEAMDEIKRLQRLLGQMTSDNALLKEAVGIMTGKNGLRAKPYQSRQIHFPCLSCSSPSALQCLTFIAATG